MAGAFQFFKQHFDVVVPLSGMQSHEKWLHFEWSSFGGVALSCQPTTQQPVDCPLEGVASATYFLFDQHGNVVVDGECGSHIMMLH